MEVTSEDPQMKSEMKESILNFVSDEIKNNPNDTQTQSVNIKNKLDDKFGKDWIVFIFSKGGFGGRHGHGPALGSPIPGTSIMIENNSKVYNIFQKKTE